MNRPAAIAPAQQASDASASQRPRDSLALGALLVFTSRRTTTMSATEAATKIIFTLKTGLASFAVASTASITRPEAALIQKPIQITGKNRSSGATGSSGPTPRRRRLMTVIGPAVNTRPSECRKSTAGYASSDGDSLSQVENALDS